MVTGTTPYIEAAADSFLSSSFLLGIIGFSFIMTPFLCYSLLTNVSVFASSLEAKASHISDGFDRSTACSRMLVTSSSDTLTTIRCVMPQLGGSKSEISDYTSDMTFSNFGVTNPAGLKPNGPDTPLVSLATFIGDMWPQYSTETELLYPPLPSLRRLC